MSTKPRETLKVIRIFIASPGDLAEERKRIIEIFEEVNRRTAKPKGFLLEPVGWEDTLPGIGRPQEIINADLVTCDHVIALLWKRWGTPTGEYSSGFEEEYCLAKSEIAKGGRVKEIWLYIKDFPEDDDEGTDEHLQQIQKVRDFRDKIIEENEGLYKTFSDIDEFKNKLTDNLCKWINDMPGQTKSKRAWNVPYPRNPNFTGREGYLAKLENTLKSGKSVALTQALTGLGGTGKTQLALEYIYLHEEDYDVIWWVRAEEPATLASDYAELADRLDLFKKDVRELDDKISTVKKWLSNNDNWLLVLDNAPDTSTIKNYIPTNPHGHVIVTSRDRFSWLSPVEVKVMEPGEATEYLLKRTRKEEDKESAAALAFELGYLPLALAQAGAYIDEVQISFSDYIILFQERRNELLERGKPSEDYQDSVYTTWNISIEKVKKRNPAAVELMNLLAFLAPDDITRDLIAKGAQYLPEPLASATRDSIDFNDTISAARRYSLIDADATNESLSMHRLVQAVIRDNLDETSKRKWAHAAVELLNNAFPLNSDQVENWPECARLISHALVTTDHALELQATSDSIGRLLNRVGLYLYGRADFKEAKATYEQALAIFNNTYGPDHPEVAKIESNIGIVLKDQGDLKSARDHFERALRINERNFGPDHIETASYANNLGLVFLDLGDLERAWVNLERAEAILSNTYGPDHPEVAKTVVNIGIVLKDQGDLKSARDHFERALRINEKAYGLDHLEVAAVVINLGAVLAAQGDLKSARDHFERALAIDEKAYGPDHPTVATDVNNLGAVFFAQGDLKSARDHFERALKITEIVYGPDHTEVAAVENNLGAVLAAQGDLKSARDHFERALNIDTKAFGPDHPEVARDVNNLGNVLQALGDLEEARAHFERALNIDTKAYGPDHPRTIIVKNNLDSLRKATPPTI
jgi:tetratricopeptide (TPR) repeat protein